MEKVSHKGDERQKPVRSCGKVFHMVDERQLSVDHPSKVTFNEGKRTINKTY